MANAQEITVAPSHGCESPASAPRACWTPRLPPQRRPGLQAFERQSLSPPPPS